MNDSIDDPALEELEKRCSELFSELTSTKQVLTNVDARLNTCKAEKSILEEKNATLVSQIEWIEQFNVCSNCEPNLANHSKELNEVGVRQWQRKIKELSTKPEKALWFLESYGVTLDRISVEDPNGRHVELHTNPENKSKSKYEDLPENQKTKTTTNTCNRNSNLSHCRLMLGLSRVLKE
jgi:chromosome segregation ATPase